MDTSNVKNQVQPKAVILILGPFCSGKKAQIRRMTDEFGYKSISFEAVLEAKSRRMSSLLTGTTYTVDSYPIDIITENIVEEIVASKPDVTLLEGFPHNKETLDAWIQVPEEKVRVKFAILLDAPFQTCMERYMAVNAVDFDYSSMMSLYSHYMKEMSPIIDYYADKLLLRIVDASPSVDEVFDEIKQVFRLASLQQSCSCQYTASFENLIEETKTNI